MDLTPSGQLAQSPVIIGGEYQDTVYGDYQAEIDMLNIAFCEVMMEGDARGPDLQLPLFRHITSQVTSIGNRLCSQRCWR